MINSNSWRRGYGCALTVCVHLAQPLGSVCDSNEVANEHKRTNMSGASGSMLHGANPAISNKIKTK